MVAYKDEERGTWYVSFYYEDWTGAKKRKVKRGFRTKKEALNFEAEYKRTAKAEECRLERAKSVFLMSKFAVKFPRGMATKAADASDSSNLLLISLTIFSL